MHSSTSVQHLKKLHGILNYSHSGVDFSFGVPYLYQITLGLVLITSCTTLAGLLPLMLLEGDGFWQTLAIVVGWGLGASTLFLILLMGIWER